MKNYKKKIEDIIIEKALSEYLVFNASDEKLHYHDKKYGTPSTTLKKEGDVYMINSRRDAERGTTYTKKHSLKENAVEEFLSMMLTDFRHY